MDQLWGVLLALGAPAAFFGAVFGLAVWYLKRTIKRSDKKREEHERNMEELVLMMLQSERANTILCKATAEAVRDGHCNGNMKAAMEVVDKAASAEKEFLLDKSIKYIFE